MLKTAFVCTVRLLGNFLCIFITSFYYFLRLVCDHRYLVADNNNSRHYKMLLRPTLACHYNGTYCNNNVCCCFFDRNQETFCHTACRNNNFTVTVLSQIRLRLM